MPVERLGVWAKAPESDEVEVGGIEHEFDADEHVIALRRLTAAANPIAKSMAGKNEI